MMHSGSCDFLLFSPHPLLNMHWGRRLEGSELGSSSNVVREGDENVRNEENMN